MKRWMPFLLMMVLVSACTLVGAKAPPITEPPPAPPAIQLSASADTVAVGEQVTLTASLQNLGQPQYQLSLSNASQADAGSQNITVLADQTLGEQSSNASYLFQVVSATATGGEVTFVLRALAPGQATVRVGANGEAQGEDGAFVPASVQSDDLTLTVSGAQEPSYTASVEIEASANNTSVGDEVTITVTSSGLGLPKYTLALQDQADPDNPILVSTGEGEEAGGEENASAPLAVITREEGGISGTEGTATFVLRAQAAGRVQIAARVNGEAAMSDGTFNFVNVTSDALTIEVSQPAQSGSVRVAEHPNLGALLVDDGGRTLYRYTGDSLATFLCEFQACAEQWTPYILDEGEPSTSAEGLGTLGIAERADGGRQVVYEGSPLFYYAGDKSAGEANGNAVAGWEVVSPGYRLNLGQYNVYSVQGGDTLSSISRRSGTSMAHLISLNLRDHPNLLSDPDGLSAGWDLFVSPPFGRAQSGGGTGGAGGTHVVQPGEHIYQIARDNGIAVAALIELNAGVYPSLRTDPNAIRPGWVLRLSSNATGDSGGGNRTYTVAKGDTLFRIGTTYGVDWEDVAIANGIISPWTIRPGQVLTIPSP
ncbi:MAG: LysM peptidoglycan-binding domain-containing protein [Chloroflexota bacterium]